MAQRARAVASEPRGRATAGGIGSHGASHCCSSRWCSAPWWEQRMCVQFSQMIILGFEGKRWSLSSKVYAEPESLYPGLPLRPTTCKPAWNVWLSAGAGAHQSGAVSRMPAKSISPCASFVIPTAASLPAPSASPFGATACGRSVICEVTRRSASST